MKSVAMLPLIFPGVLERRPRGLWILFPCLGPAPEADTVQ